MHSNSASAFCIVSAANFRWMSIADRLKQRRIERGFETAKAAADAMRVPESTYTQNENGTREPSKKRLKQYADFYRCTPEWLLWGNEKPPARRSSARGPAITRLLGLVGAGEKLDALQFDNPESIDLPIALGESEAYQVKGTSCLPVFEEGDVVVTGAPVGPGRHHRRFCVVETADGEGFIKRVDKIEVMIDGSQQAWLSGTDDGEDAGVQIIKWAKPVVLRIIRGGR
jgi:transcriptional regulator with XRE-family HTH domain